MLVAWTAPSHYLNQCWNIVNWTLGNKLQWNLNRNLNIFIKENAFENVVWKMAAILSRPQCANIYHFYTSDIFYTDVYYFTFVVPEMYQWQVRNDFNKDVYIYNNIIMNGILIICQFRLRLGRCSMKHQNNPFNAKLYDIVRKHEIMIAVSTNAQHWDGVGSWIPS